MAADSAAFMEAAASGEEEDSEAAGFTAVEGLAEEDLTAAAVVLVAADSIAVVGALGAGDSTAAAVGLAEEEKDSTAVVLAVGDSIVAVASSAAARATNSIISDSVRAASHQASFAAVAPAVSTAVTRAIFDPKRRQAPTGSTRSSVCPPIWECTRPAASNTPLVSKAVHAALHHPAPRLASAAVTSINGPALTAQQ